MFSMGVRLRWINGACYEMVLPDGTVIVLDPYVTPEKLEGFNVDDFTGADYILCSHTHYDHTADIGALADKFNSKIIAGEMSIMALANYFDLNYNHCYPISSGEGYDMPEFSVYAIRSKHVGGFDKLHGTPSATLESAARKNMESQGPADQFGWVELYDYAITLPGNFRILIVAGVNAYSNIYEFAKQFRPNLVIRQTVGTKREYAELIDRFKVPFVLPNHHENPMRRFGMPMEEYVEEVNAELRTINSPVTLINPVQFKWYQFGYQLISAEENNKNE